MRARAWGQKAGRFTGEQEAWTGRCTKAGKPGSRQAPTWSEMGETEFQGQPQAPGKGLNTVADEEIGCRFG